MRIKSVTLENFMAYRGSYTLPFREHQIVGILGEYEGEDARSNRAGKSAFFDAVHWCLTGKSRAKRDVQLIHHGQDRALVSVALEADDGAIATVTRWRHADNTGGLELVGYEGARKAVSQDAIDKLVGLNHRELEVTAFFKQGDIDQFMQADAQEKKTILRKWVEVAGWSRYEEDATAFKRKLTEEQTRLRTLLAAIGDDTTFDKDKLIAQQKELAAALEKLDAASKSCSDGLVRAELRIKELERGKEQATRLEFVERKIRQLKEGRPDGDAVKAELVELDMNLAKYPIMTGQQKTEAVEKRDLAVGRLADVAAAERLAMREQEVMSRERTGLCPLLKEACSRIEVTVEAKEDLKRRIAGFAERRERLEQTKERCGKVIRLHDMQEGWRREKAQLAERASRAKQVEKEIAEWMTERDKIRVALPVDAAAQEASARDEVRQWRERGQEIAAKIRGYQAQQGQVSQMFKQTVENEAKRAAYTKQLTDLEEQLGDAAYVAYMFGKNGIPSEQLENSFGQIERDANLVLRRLKAPFQVEIRATRELQTWEEACLACGKPFERGQRKPECRTCGVPRAKKQRDELDFKVLENGTERDFNMDSGGGKVLLSVGIRVALTLLARRRTGAAWSVLFMDEIFGALDPVNRKAMAELITTTLRRDLGFKQIFLISHTPDVQSAIADTLTVFRHKGGWSEPRWTAGEEDVDTRSRKGGVHSGGRGKEQSAGGAAKAAVPVGKGKGSAKAPTKRSAQRAEA